MTYTTHKRAIRIPEKISRGAALLKRREQRVEEQAHSSGKMGRADLHMHSTYSDGIATIEQILDYVERHTSLDVIALTDHDVVEGALRARDLWAKGSYRFDFVVGEEISTNEGHLLALFIEKCIPPNLSIERSIDLVHEQGGLAIVAHPLHPWFRWSCQREVLDRIYASPNAWLDGIEAWNAGFCGIYANHATSAVNQRVYHWPEVGNSDAHTVSSIGCGYTWFEGTSALDLRSSIETGSTAPGGKMWGMNDYLHLAGNVVARVASPLRISTMAKKGIAHQQRIA